MKRCFFISALVIGVAVGQAEPQNASVPQNGNVSRRVAHGSQEDKGGEIKRGRASRLFPGNWLGGENGEPENKDLSSQEETLPNIRSSQTPQVSVESVYLKEIAASLSISVSENDTPGDITFKIKQRLRGEEGYRGGVLSDESFELAKSAILILTDAEIFAEYHKFIKKIADKKVIVIE